MGSQTFLATGCWTVPPTVVKARVTAIGGGGGGAGGGGGGGYNFIGSPCVNGHTGSPGSSGGASGAGAVTANGGTVGGGGGYGEGSSPCSCGGPCPGVGGAGGTGHNAGHAGDTGSGCFHGGGGSGGGAVCGHGAGGAGGCGGNGGIGAAGGGGGGGGGSGFVVVGKITTVPGCTVHVTVGGAGGRGTGGAPGTGSFSTGTAGVCGTAGSSGAVTLQWPCSPLAVSPKDAPTSGPVGTTVHFTANPSGGSTPYSYAWCFGCACHRTSTCQNPAHTYTKHGTYTPTLTLTCGVFCCSVSASACPVTITSGCTTGGTLGNLIVGRARHPKISTTHRIPLDDNNTGN